MFWYKICGLASSVRLAFQKKKKKASSVRLRFENKNSCHLCSFLKIV